MLNSKHCPKCGIEKLYEEFPPRKISQDGRASWCKICSRKASKAWAERPENRKKHSEKGIKQRKLNKEKLIKYFGNKCADCGNSYPPKVYDFHHLDPTQKEYTFARLGHLTWKHVEKEIIPKCIMLCSNCHRIRHDNT